MIIQLRSSSVAAHPEKQTASTARQSRTQHIQQPQLQDLLPPLTPEEYEWLKASIADHGVEKPVVVDQNENIVDGYERQKACDELGIDPKERKCDESDEEN